jgi:hypothetical protein
MLHCYGAKEMNVNNIWREKLNPNREVRKKVSLSKFFPGKFSRCNKQPADYRREWKEYRELEPNRGKVSSFPRGLDPYPAYKK